MGCCALILKSFGSQIKSLASNPIPPEHSYGEQLRNTSLFSLSSHPRSSSPLHPASLALPFFLAAPPTRPNDSEWGLGCHPWRSTHCPASDHLHFPAAEDPAGAPGRSGDALWPLPALLSLSPSLSLTCCRCLRQLLALSQRQGLGAGHPRPAAQRQEGRPLLLLPAHGPGGRCHRGDLPPPLPP